MFVKFGWEPFHLVASVNEFAACHYFAKLNCPVISEGEEVEIHSFILGVPIHLSPSNRCEILNLTKEGDCVYLIINKSINMFTHTIEQIFSTIFQNVPFNQKVRAGPSETSTLLISIFYNNNIIPRCSHHDYLSPMQPLFLYAIVTD